jgi:hypothetical protein
MHMALHFNMCNLESSYTFDSDVPMLNDRVQQNIPPTLQYVSRHWAKHMHHTEPAGNNTNDLFSSLNDFMCNRLLFWIEAMNLIGAKFECQPLLEHAQDWAKKVRLQNLLGNACSKGLVRAIGQIYWNM